VTSETTTDMERLRARDEPGLREALTRDCWCVRNDVDTEPCDHKPFCNSDVFRTPLAPDSAHVALERWCMKKYPNGAIIIERESVCFEMIAHAHITNNADYGVGTTLPDAVLAALEK